VWNANGQTDYGSDTATENGDEETNDNGSENGRVPGQISMPCPIEI
jgi:hypothetical protein